VAYNSKDNEYLVVWHGNTAEGGLVVGEFEIWGHLLKGDSTPIESGFRISDMGPKGDADYDALFPDVAYNSTDNQYMVVWEGDDQAYDRVDDEFEIWGQRLNASGGVVGVTGFRISTMGPYKDPDRWALRPAIAYNPQNNEYLVVWYGDHFADNLFDVFGQRLQADGSHVGADDFPMSMMDNGPNLDYFARHPAVAYDGRNNEYLVVWQDDELLAGEYEVFGQRVDAASGKLLDGNTRLSDMGPYGDTLFDANSPAVAYGGAANNQYLVVWYGDDSTDGDYEIWGQRFAGGHWAYLPLAMRNH
jgi:hypothetical protein